MNSTIAQICISLFSILLSTNVTYSQHIVSFESLLHEMTDRETLAEYPSPTYSCKQLSSYDRASVNPNQKSWFANWDRSMFLRMETINGRKEYVLMDAEGPGAIVRMWMTFSGENSGRGILRIYLDDYSTPVIEGDALSIISGGKLVDEPLSSSVSNLTDYNMRGHNLYLPIPYAEKCKITYESDNITSAGAKSGGEAVYYNINYRTYESTTRVKTFDLAQFDKFNFLIEITQNKLKEKKLSLPLEFKKDSLKRLISASESLDLTINSLNSAIRKITIKLNAENYEQALRSTIIQISFDGNKTICCPIGDFFGTGYIIHENNSWYTKIEENGTMSCYWVMPFKKQCEIEIKNIGCQDVNVIFAEFTTCPYKWTSNTMYFGSFWKQYSFLKTGEMKNNEGDGYPFDINYVNLKGKGVYVGDCLTLFNTVYAWWGEGDEKIHVDGEKFPSHFGTGTEDYYGYAWCRPEKFNGHPFIAQLDGSGNFDPGYTNNIRFRSLDVIPFDKSLRFDIEMWHWTKAIIHFSPISFWYISPKNVENIPHSDLKDASTAVALKREDIISPVLVNNKIEAENMIIEKTEGGNFRYSNNVNRGWSNNMQAFWSGMKSNDTLKLSFFSNKEEVTNVRIKYSKGPGYGSFLLSINKEDFIIIDSFGKNDTINEISFNNIAIHEGNNFLNIVYLKPEDKNQVGIDCIELFE